MTLGDVQQIFSFAGGLGMFLYGMDVMAKGLQQVAGEKMKKMLGVLTSNRLLGILLGVVFTAIIQSSSATTVMVVGFVNAGIMNLSQAVGVIMGANIGTTATAWIVSLGEFGEVMNPEFFAPVLVFFGVILYVFTKSEKKKEIGEIFVGLGMLFIGLSFMSGAIEPYRESELFAAMFRVLGKNPVLGIFAGAVVTAIIQSSSASVGILQTLAMNGMVSFRSAIFITLGQNIGTCVTALISSAGTHRTAKRAAVIHLLFNVFGAIVFGIGMYLLFMICGDLADSMITSVQISLFHTIFNLSNTVILLPFSNALVKLSGILVKERGEEQTAEDKEVSRLRDNLDERILETPSFALSMVQKELVYMGELALENAKKAVEALLTNHRGLVTEVVETEQIINKFETMLTEYLVKIDLLNLNEKEHLQLKNYMNTISDIERISDHAENVAELAGEKVTRGIHFSEEANQDMRLIFGYVTQSVENAILARKEEKMDYIHAVVRYEELVDVTEEKLREKHIKRLSDGECKVENGVIFLDAINNLERISDHADNIAGYVKNEL